MRSRTRAASATFRRSAATGCSNRRGAQIFGSGSYLANPRDTNGTPSLTVTRLPPGVSPAASSFDRLVNSVPDQYVTRLGAAVGLWKSVAASASYRVEGQRRYDLIGRSHGFRRPGVAMFVEPGLSYSSGGQSISVTMPISFYRNRKPDPCTGLEGDATFPRFILMASYGLRFGARKPAAPPWTTPPSAP